MFAQLRKFGMNLALWADHGLNTILLGDPNETVSRRVGRAAEENQKWACVFCHWLSQTFGKDHCQKAIEPGTSGREIWHWSNNPSEPDLVDPATKNS